MATSPSVRSTNSWFDESRVAFGVTDGSSNDAMAGSKRCGSGLATLTRYLPPLRWVSPAGSVAMPLASVVRETLAPNASVTVTEAPAKGRSMTESHWPLPPMSRMTRTVSASSPLAA